MLLNWSVPALFSTKTTALLCGGPWSWEVVDRLFLAQQYNTTTIQQHNNITIQQHNNTRTQQQRHRAGRYDIDLKLIGCLTTTKGEWNGVLWMLWNSAEVFRTFTDDNRIMKWGVTTLDWAVLALGRQHQDHKIIRYEAPWHRIRVCRLFNLDNGITKRYGTTLH